MDSVHDDNNILNQHEQTNEEENQENEKNNKKILGQFFTTNYKYILNDMKIPNYVEAIIEPFCGNGDLIEFIKEQQKNNPQKQNYKTEYLDIEPKHPFISKRDTIKNPPSYINKYIITNPPYLARNKSKDKTMFDKYDVNDLYKCFLKEIISDTNYCLGGIIIIPINFWGSIRKNDIVLRKSFLEMYHIVQLNIFEEQVFDDTTSTICSFQFEKRRFPLIDKNIPLSMTIYPMRTTIDTTLNRENNYMIGGHIYHLKTKGNYKISRITRKNKEKKNTNILVRCIDSNEENQINLYIVDDEKIFIDETPNQSARTMMSLIIEPEINMEKQKILVEKFNLFLNDERKKYNSMFLSNYRESKDISRKRISFDLVFKIVEYILDNLESS
jgi:hypothetical protein